MKKYLLSLNHAYLFFGTTVYVGVLWALRFFWYDSWTGLTLENVEIHFMGPTGNATKFFTIVVPIMLLSSIIMIITEWKTKFVWLAVIAFLCIAGSTIVGKYLIIPVNETIGKGVGSMDELGVLLNKWMSLNNIRWTLMSIMWLDMMVYFIFKGNLPEALVSKKSTEKGKSLSEKKMALS